MILKKLFLFIHFRPSKSIATLVLATADYEMFIKFLQVMMMFNRVSSWLKPSNICI